MPVHFCAPSLASIVHDIIIKWSWLLLGSLEIRVGTRTWPRVLVSSMCSEKSLGVKKCHNDKVKAADKESLVCVSFLGNELELSFPGWGRGWGASVYYGTVATGREQAAGQSRRLRSRSTISDWLRLDGFTSLPSRSETIRRAGWLPPCARNPLRKRLPDAGLHGSDWNSCCQIQAATPRDTR